MNKKSVEEYLPSAIEALEKCGIYDKDKDEIKRTFRGQISSFGAAVSMGSFKAAVAFFSDKNGSSVDRQNLIKALWFITQNDNKESKDICKIILTSTDLKASEYETQFLDASIALKLAMNAYNLTK